MERKDIKAHTRTQIHTHKAGDRSIHMGTHVHVCSQEVVVVVGGGGLGDNIQIDIGRLDQRGGYRAGNKRVKEKEA